VVGSASGFVPLAGALEDVFNGLCCHVEPSVISAIPLKKREQETGSSVKRDTLPQGGARSQKSEVNASLTPGF
jgi:hypothetical protein